MQTSKASLGIRNTTFLVALFLLVVLVGFAPPLEAYDGWSPASGRTKVELIRHQGWRILVRQVTSANPGGCSATNGYMKIDDSNSEWRDQLYALVLAAHLGGKDVAFAVDGCSSGYPVITEVIVED